MTEIFLDYQGRLNHVMTSVLKSKREAEEQVRVMPREEVSLSPAVAIYADGKVREACRS